MWTINTFAVSIDGFIYFLFSCTDILSLTHQGREHLTHEKERFAHEHPQMRNLEDVVRDLKPTAIIGRMNLSFGLGWMERYRRRTD